MSEVRVNLNWLGPFFMKDRTKLLTDTILGSGFYMFIGIKPKQPLYIGQAYHKSIRIRITSHRSYTDKIGRWSHKQGISIEKVPFKVAYFVSEDKTLYRDIENLLVYYAKPNLNIEFKETYSGRNLEIHNRGEYEPLGEILNGKNTNLKEGSY